jgi:CD109 antigen
VFQPFFLQADLPYSSIRGEEFPVKIALYNYLDTEQEIQVDLESAGWFDLLDDSTKTVTVAPNEVGSAEFKIRPKTIGTQLLEVTARSSEAADAVNKSLIVEPVGVGRERTWRSQAACWHRPSRGSINFYRCPSDAANRT